MTTTTTSKDLSHHDKFSQTENVAEICFFSKAEIGFVQGPKAGGQRQSSQSCLTLLQSKAKIYDSNSLRPWPGGSTFIASGWPQEARIVGKYSTSIHYASTGIEEAKSF